MKSSKQEALRKWVYKMLGRSNIVEQFKNSQPRGSGKKTGHPPKLGLQKVGKLQSLVKVKIGASIQTLSRKLNVSHIIIVRN
ncbi:hypothetical protein ILUMI_20543 [Ignelater luminosus]|uniref:Uncharacterized protein n=1 Tax=Ignelater luminosus TaxID=2038154 RepID=A0A8K0FYU0_IGNLU|nr:hypothetical protein ILUMI_20543 [Ignelater luminosus]